MTSELTMSGTSPQIKFNDTDADDFWIHVNSNNFYVLTDRDDNGSWDGSNPLMLQNSDSQAYVYGHKVWNAGNDGVGSGLDADLLDGQQGSYYYPASNPNGYTNDQTAAEILTKVKTVDGSGSGLDADLLDGQQGSYYMPADTSTIQQANFISGSAFSTSAAPGSVLEYAQASSVTDTKVAPSTDWYNSIRMGHGDPYSYYSNTIAVRMTGAGSGTIYTQTISNNNAQGWNKHWHNNNDGAGSGLDADTLDGIQASAFALLANTPQYSEGTTAPSGPNGSTWYNTAVGKTYMKQQNIWKQIAPGVGGTAVYDVNGTKVS